MAPTWEQVVRDHSARVYRLAYRLSGNPQDAEDLTQETFVRVFRSLADFSPGTFEGWLHRITTNLFLDMVRRRQRIRFDALPEDTERLPGTAPSPEQVYADTHLDPQVQAALDALSPEFRVAVVLCDIEGLTYEEIAATLGIKLGTVRSRIHRGRVQLRQALAHLAPGRRPYAGRETRRRERRMSIPESHLAQEAIAALVDGELAAGPAGRAARHLAGCLQCRLAVRGAARGQGGAARVPGRRRPRRPDVAAVRHPLHHRRARVRRRGTLAAGPGSLTVTGASGSWSVDLQPEERPQRPGHARWLRRGLAGTLIGLGAGVTALALNLPGGRVPGRAGSRVPRRRVLAPAAHRGRPAGRPHASPSGRARRVARPGGTP